MKHGRWIKSYSKKKDRRKEMNKKKEGKKRRRKDKEKKKERKYERERDLRRRMKEKIEFSPLYINSFLILYLSISVFLFSVSFSAFISSCISPTCFITLSFLFHLPIHLCLTTLELLSRSPGHVFFLFTYLSLLSDDHRQVKFK